LRAHPVAAARSFGDLSHNVYVPSQRSKQSSAKAGELLFLDRWDNPQGIMEFFSNPHVQGQAAKMFSARDAAVWMPARGSFSYRLPAPRAKSERYVGIIRGPVKTPEQAIAVFTAADQKAQRTARKRGLLSHELFITLAAPGDSSPLELIGIDVWCDFAGMTEHYGDPQEMAALGGAFAGAPQASVWEQAPGNWSEW
jgi:quinol monooxygenase YgiN